MSRNTRSRLRAPAIFAVLVVLFQASAAHAAERFSFEENLQGWTRDHFIDCEQDPEPCDFNWRINRSTQ